jgi:hypothetical protein
MLFSVLEKIESERTDFADAELPYLMPYLGQLPKDAPLRQGLSKYRLYNRLIEAVKSDKDWSENMGAQFAYDMLFEGGVASPGLKDMLLKVLGTETGGAYGLSFMLVRGVQDGNIKAVRAITELMTRLAAADEDDPLAAILSAEDDSLMQEALRRGGSQVARHLFVCAAPPRNARTATREWLLSGHRGARLLAAAAQSSDDSLTDMILNRARRAGVEKQVLGTALQSVLYHVAHSGNEQWLRRTMDKAQELLGPAALTESFARDNGALFWAVARDPAAVSMDRTIGQLSSRIGEISMRVVLDKAWRIGSDMPVERLQAVMDKTVAAGGRDYLCEKLFEYQALAVHFAGMSQDTGLLRAIDRTAGPDFMCRLLEDKHAKGQKFLATFINHARLAPLRYMTTRAHQLCGEEPLRNMLLACAQPGYVNRADYMDMIQFMLREVSPRITGGNAAIPVSTVQLLNDHKAKKIPPHVFWQKIGGGRSRWQALANRPPPAGLDALASPWQFKPQLYDELLPLMKIAARLEDAKHPETWAYRLCVLFKNRQEVERYLDQAVKRARPDSKLMPVTQATNFVIPARGLWTTAHWRAVTMKYGRAAGRFVSIAPQIEDYCREKTMDLPKTPAEIRDVARFVLYADAHKNPEFARLAVEHDLPENLFNEGVKWLSAARGNGDVVPDIRIDGADIGKSNYYLEKLKRGDPHGPILGYVTNSCQSLGNAGEYAARHGTMYPDGGFYVWRQKTKGAITPQDRIVAESWVWLSPDRKTLVFDSFERLSAAYNHLALPFMQQCAHDLAVQGKIAQVHLGAGGNTPAGHGLREAFNTVAPSPVGQKHPDSAVQYAVPPLDQRRPATAPQAVAQPS